MLNHRHLFLFWVIVLTACLTEERVQDLTLFAEVPSQWSGSAPVVLQEFDRLPIEQLQPPELTSTTRTVDLLKPMEPLGDFKFWSRVNVSQRMSLRHRGVLSLQVLKTPKDGATHWGEVLWREMSPQINGRGLFAQNSQGQWYPVGTFIFEHAVDQGSNRNSYLRCAFPYLEGKLQGTIVCDMDEGRQLQEVVGPDTLESRWLGKNGMRRWRNLRHGVRHGPSVYWHQNGALSSTTRYVEGQFEGCSKYYYRNGFVRKRVCTDSLGTTRSIVNYLNRKGPLNVFYQEERNEIGEVVWSQGVK